MISNARLYLPTGCKKFRPDVKTIYRAVRYPVVCAARINTVEECLSRCSHSTQYVPMRSCYWRGQVKNSIEHPCHPHPSSRHNHLGHGLSELGFKCGERFTPLANASLRVLPISCDNTCRNINLSANGASNPG